MGVTNSKMPKKKELNCIPKHVLHQLIEHTPGGFLLFTFNHQTGFPEHTMTFDSPAFYLAMTKYISDWSAATNKMQIAVASNDISRIIITPDESAESDDASTK